MFQDGQIFKERCEDSPGILLFCQGDWWHPTAERVAMLERENYLVLTAANGREDIPFWLPNERCIGGMFGHESTVAEAQELYPDKVIERYEGVGGRFLRTISQGLPNALHYGGFHYDSVCPREVKTVDVISAFAPVALKRGNLLLETLIRSEVSAYIFSHNLGSEPRDIENLVRFAGDFGQSVDFFHYPFDPYALIKIGEKIVIDGRPFSSNNSIVSNYLSRARLYVHTSTTEGFSNSVMEALHNDVPVLLCEDILGPLQTLRHEIPNCIYSAPPTVSGLLEKMRFLLDNPPKTGVVKSEFDSVLNPFEINRRVVRGAQRWFEQHGLPWKGHCLGILGGIQSRMEIESVTSEQSYRGVSPIYFNPDSAREYIAFHANAALQKGKNDLLISLVEEMKILSGEK